MHEIRLCYASELQKLMRFIKESWKNDHIFTRDAELLAWQHYNKKDDVYNFIVACNNTTKEFDAVLGFIPLSHFNNKLTDRRDFWLAIWKNDKKKSGNSSLGIELLYTFEHMFNPESIGAISVSDDALKVYSTMKYNTGVLEHYYIPNTEIHEFNIAKIRAEKLIRDKIIGTTSKVSQIKDIRKIGKIECSFRPEKSVDYLIGRFCRHPRYEYKFYGAYNENKLQTIFVTRKNSVNNNSCIHIVDIYGNMNIKNIRTEFENILIEENSEYIDCINYGIDEPVFTSMGFIKKDDETVIPSYFEPFERRNVKISFAYKAKYNGYVIFKADSDQDRPNK